MFTDLLLDALRTQDAQLEQRLLTAQRQLEAVTDEITTARKELAEAITIVSGLSREQQASVNKLFALATEIGVIS